MLTVLTVPDPAGGPPSLLVGTGPWGTRGIGFSLLGYRCGPDGVMRRYDRNRVGKVFQLVRANLDGRGDAEVYASIGCKPTRAQDHIFREFERPGIYRVDPRDLRSLHLVHRTSRKPALLNLH